MGYIDSEISGQMNNYSEDNLVDMVRLRMAEIHPDIIEDVGIEQNKPLTSIISGLLNECRIDVLTDAPMSKIPKKLAEEYDVDEVGEDSGIGTFVMADDMIRIGSVKSSAWKRIVTTVSDSRSAGYKRMAYDFIRPTAKNPVLVLEDGTTFTIAPYSSNDIISIIYVSSLAPYESFSEQMINAICWDCAAKAFLALGETDNYAKALELYKNLVK